LIDALAAGTYEVDVVAGWASGDFDGSGRFDSSDLIEALADGIDRRTLPRNKMAKRWLIWGL
jgi:hypothetical protein